MSEVSGFEVAEMLGSHTGVLESELEHVALDGEPALQWVRHLPRRPVAVSPLMIESPLVVELVEATRRPPVVRELLAVGRHPLVDGLSVVGPVGTPSAAVVRRTSRS